MEWVAGFIEKQMFSVQEERSISVVDLNSLGKLFISKNSIEYQNARDGWKYSLSQPLVKLPRLLNQISETQSVEKMSRAFSLSLHKKKRNEQEKG